MGENSKIEWTDHTFNPWRGCTKVAEGCAHCYADAQAKRNPGTLGIWGQHGTRVVASESGWRMPRKWNDHAECLRTFDCNAGDHGDVCPQKNRPRIFCASMADVFEDWNGALTDSSGQRVAFNTYTMQMKGVGRDLDKQPLEGWRWATMDDLRRRLFALIDATPNLDWLLLTKRPQNVPNMWPLELIDGTASMHGIRKRPNVWLGTSIANQADADKNIPTLLACRDLVPVLFLSAEPLLGPIDFNSMTTDAPNSGFALHDGWGRFDGEPPSLIDWVIAGGESGHHARPMHPDWARSLRDQCQAAGVAFHFKQWGEWLPVGQNPAFTTEYPSRGAVGQVNLDYPHPLGHWAFRVGKAAAGRLLDGRTWDEFPQIPPHDPAAVPGGT